MNTLYKALGLSLCLSLIGCLNSEDKKSSSSESSSEAVPVTMGSVSTDKNCSNGQQGAMIYDQAQSQFFVCTSGAWVAVDLRGPKGDKGDTGANGADGVTGATGAVGANGTNGRDGLDGNGVRLALKENGQVKGFLVQYELEGYRQDALMMLPSGDLIYIDVDTGVFAGRPAGIYYAESGCKGASYVSRNQLIGPHTIGRIYVGIIDSNFTPIAFYRAVETMNRSATKYRSMREYNTQGQYHTCRDFAEERSDNWMTRVEEIPAPASLTHLAPIKFTL